MANVARNVAKRNRMMYGLVALTILLAFHAKMRGASEEAEMKQETKANINQHQFIIRLVLFSK